MRRGLPRAALLVSAALAACGPAEPRPQEAAVPEARAASQTLRSGETRVTRRGGRVSVVANGAAPLAALTELSMVASFRVERGLGRVPEEPLSFVLEEVTVERAVTAILAGAPFHLHYEFADGDLSPERPFEGRATALARVTVGELSEGPADRPRELEGGRQREATAPPPAQPRGGPNARTPDVESRAPQLDEAARRERERAEEVARTWQDPREAVRLEAVARMEPEGEDLERLRALLSGDPSAEVRVAAAEALADGDPFAAADPLLAALADPAPEVVVAAVQALEDLYDEAPDPRIREAVAALREHREAGVRSAVQEFEEWIE